MSENSKDSEPTICEAIGCSAKATNNIAVRIDEKKTISVKLCKSCAKLKFGASTEHTNREY